MKPEDLTRISNAIDAALRPYIRDIVELECRLIPHKIREEVHNVMLQITRGELRNLIQDSFTVEVSIKPKRE